MAAIPDLPRFDTVAEAVVNSLEYGIGVVSSKSTPEQIQNNYLLTQIDTANRAHLSLEVAGVIVPEIAEIVEITRESLIWPEYAKIFRHPLGRIGTPHRDFGGLVVGLSILAPIGHGSKFTVFSPDWRKTVYQGEYLSGDLLIMRQRINGFEATPHTFSVVTEVADLERFPVERVLMTVDSIKVSE